MHAFTFCDTVSACAGREKMRIFMIVKTNKTYELNFCRLGRTWDVSVELFQETSRNHWPYIYIPSTDATSVNNLRYQFFLFNE